MELIKKLESNQADGRTIQFIQFSENAKYVGYGQLSGGTPKATFFTCEPPFKKWELKVEFKITDTIKITRGFNGIGFIDDNYAFLSGIVSSNNRLSIIYDINNEKQIYKTDVYFSYNPLYNKSLNTIITGGNGLVSLDFNNILNSVGVEEPRENHPNFLTEYREGILIVTDYESINPEFVISIINTKGNLVFQKQILTNSSSDKIDIPVILPSGVYFIHFNDGSKEYSSKFLVVE